MTTILKWRRCYTSFMTITQNWRPLMGLWTNLRCILFPCQGWIYMELEDVTRSSEVSKVRKNKHWGRHNYFGDEKGILFRSRGRRRWRGRRSAWQRRRRGRPSIISSPATPRWCRGILPWPAEHPWVVPFSRVGKGRNGRLPRQTAARQ